MRYNLRTLLILAATTGWLSLAPATAEQPTSAPATTSQARYVSPTDRQGFNPQPDPPAKQEKARLFLFSFASIPHRKTKNIIKNSGIRFSGTFS